MAPLVIMVTVVAVFFCVLFWYVLQSESNSGPALGNNSPYPTDISGEEPPYLPGPVISADEEFRRNAGSMLSHGRGRKHTG